MQTDYLGSQLIWMSKSKLSSLLLKAPIFGIWGSNTGVGKTAIAAGIAAASNRASTPLFYLKPVQTGFPAHSDGRLVAAVGNLVHDCADHAHHLEKTVTHRRLDTVSHTRTLYAWSEPVSPHLAVQREGRHVGDDELLHSVLQNLNFNNASLKIVESAGGVASPGPSGRLLCDILRPLRLPAVLVGDGALGGISTTLSSYEFLKGRGYDIPFLAVADSQNLDNATSLKHHLSADSVDIISFPPLPKPPSTPSMHGLDPEFLEWLESASETFDRMIVQMQRYHDERMRDLIGASAKARKTLWWPFTQHAAWESESAEHTITLIESRAGENFAAFNEHDRSIDYLYDGCASWWTQGVGSQQHQGLSSAIAHAAARYGHVMFPENAHKPALDLTEMLLARAGAGWASRAFFSDNGSTAIEVALKMAFRKYAHDHDLLASNGVEMHVLGLEEAYHGDTLGAMDAVAPSVFNGRLQTPWYTGRGLFLKPKLLHDTSIDWSAEDFHRHIEHYEQSTRKLGALIIEPLMQGAGGMRVIDPAWQSALVNVCRERRIPVIYDEVFTGLFRLGWVTAGQVLGVKPDIACYAKLLTGGIVPLAITLASESIFEAFLETNRKDKALLHGHSYTAHAIGCAAAVYSLKTYFDRDVNHNLTIEGHLQPLWNPSLVEDVAQILGAERATAMGTVVAFDFGDDANVARSLALALRHQANIYARPLGGVVYLMVTPLTSPQTCSELLNRIRSVAGKRRSRRNPQLPQVIHDLHFI